MFRIEIYQQCKRKKIKIWENTGIYDMVYNYFIQELPQLCQTLLIIKVNVSCVWLRISYVPKETM